MPLPKSHFDPIHTGRADPSRYLIIGFDIEYQRYADDQSSCLDDINDLLSRLAVSVDVSLSDSQRRMPCQHLHIPQ